MQQGEETVDALALGLAQAPRGVGQWQLEDLHESDLLVQRVAQRHTAVLVELARREAKLLERARVEPGGRPSGVYRHGLSLEPAQDRARPREASRRRAHKNRSVISRSR